MTELEVLGATRSLQAAQVVDELRASDAEVDSITQSNYLANAPAAALSNMLPIVLIALFCISLPQWHLMSVLLAGQTGVNLFKLLHARRLKKAPSRIGWRVYELSFAVTGALWGAMLFPLIEWLGRSQTSTIVYIVLFATVAITSMAIAGQRRLFTAFIFGFGGAASLGAFALVHQLGIAPYLAILGFILILDSITKASYRQGQALIRGQLENRLLAEKLAETLEASEYLASRDSLTGLFNRRAFEAAALELRATHGDESTMHLILLDLDHFKTINDEFGHATGDLVLKHTASLIMETVGELQADGSDQEAVFARWGGEEFIILLGHHSLELATRTAEAIRINLATRSLPDGRDTVSASGSLGIAQWHGTDDLHRVIGLADKAMYSAKNSGRNHVCISVEGHFLPVALAS